MDYGQWLHQKVIFEYIIIYYPIMKKTIFYSIMMMLSAGAVCCSCSDDDEGNANSYAASNPLASQGKVLLTQLDYECFEYDENLRPVAAYYDDYGLEDEWRINYEKGLISLYDGEYPNLSCSFNSKGYITKIKGSVSESEYEDGVKYTEEMTVTMTFEYDGEGHLRTHRYTEDSKYTEGSEVETEHYDDCEEYTWEQGNLVKMERKYLTEEDKDDNYIIEATYGEQENKYRQYPGDWSNYDDKTMLAVGLCGIGPKNLLASYRKSYGSHYGYERSVEYILNEDGTIKQEIWSGGDTYDFTYTPIEQYLPSAPKAVSTRSTTVSRLSAREKAERLRRFCRGFSLMHNVGREDKSVDVR